MQLTIPNIRTQLVNFLVDSDTTHFVTFVFNSDACEANARYKLKDWLKRVDNFALGNRYWKKRGKRIFFIAVPESLGVNTHYHAFLKWPESYKETEKIIKFAQGLWRGKLVKSGDLDVQELTDRIDAARYSTKQLRQSVGSWLVSTEFHVD